MSDNLISRQAVLDIIQDEWNLHIGYDSDIALGSVKNRVSALPIAYDKEAVVEQLEEYQQSECKLKDQQSEGNFKSRTIGRMEAFEKAIDIAKAGGIDG